MPCTFADLVKNTCKDPTKDPNKNVGGIGFTRCILSICFKPKNDYVQIGREVTRINQRITVKRHAHLQTSTKTYTKIQKYLSKAVGGVVISRYPVPQCLNLKKKSKLQKNDKIILRITPKRHAPVQSLTITLAKFHKD